MMILARVSLPTRLLSHVMPKLRPREVKVSSERAKLAARKPEGFEAPLLSRTLNSRYNRCCDRSARQRALQRARP